MGLPMCAARQPRGVPQHALCLLGRTGGIQHMKDLGNTIYSFGYAVAATVLGIGVAYYWFGNHQLTAFLSWAVLATIPWLVGRASLYVLARR